MSFKQFEALCGATEQELWTALPLFLKKYGYKEILVTKDYVMARGTLPVMLAAHLDTVFTGPPEHIYYDVKAHVAWSPNGMGADDRAGVYAIARILKETDYRPHLLFSMGEEKGCVGVSQLIRDYRKFPWGKLKYIAQLDRRGKEDCVFYDCANEDFIKYIEDFGFKTAYGTFTDITVICPVWRVAGVNLSVGYENEHSIAEYLKFDDLELTIARVKHMLSIAQYGDVFVYKKRTEKFPVCDICGKAPINGGHRVFMWGEKPEYPNSLYMCIDCYNQYKPSVRQCEHCSQYYYSEGSGVCPSCLKSSTESSATLNSKNQ